MVPWLYLEFATLVFVKWTIHINILVPAFWRQVQIQTTVVNCRQLAYTSLSFNWNQRWIETPWYWSCTIFTIFWQGLSVVFYNVFPIMDSRFCAVYFILFWSRLDIAVSSSSALFDFALVFACVLTTLLGLPVCLLEICGTCKWRCYSRLGMQEIKGMSRVRDCFNFDCTYKYTKQHNSPNPMG